MKRVLAALFVLAATWTPAAAHAVTLKLVKQLDMAALNAGQPGSVAAYGNELYVGSLFGGAKLYRISNPLGAATLANVFGGVNDPATNGGIGPHSGNGYVSLYTDGRTLVAATDQGSPDVVQAFAFGSDAFTWGNHAAALPMRSGGAIDGAAIDPTTGHVMLTCFGCDDQNFRNVATGTAETVAGENILFYPGVGTGWKDIDYDKATGDIYLRAWGGVARGKKVAPGQFQTLEGDPGVQTIVDGLNNNFRSAINVAFLPADFAGQPLVILNDRDATAAVFDARVKLYAATPPSSAGTATDVPVAVNFVLGDGVTPFVTASAGSGIYDFSYDPVFKKLYISDFSTSQVHVFGAVPEPHAGLLAAAMAAAGAARRRRGC